MRRHPFVIACLLAIMLVGSVGASPLTLLAQEQAVAPAEEPTPANQAPVATDDYAETWAGTTVVFPVVQTDADPDGLPQPLSIIQLGPTIGGQAWLDGVDSIAYLPNLDFAGTEVISYIISDGELTATANLIVTVLPLPATETPIPTDVPPTDIPATEAPSATSEPSRTQTVTDAPVLAAAIIPVGTSVRPNTNVNLRSGASTSSSSLGLFRSNMTGVVSGAPIMAGGQEWYPVTVSGLGSGYVSSTYLRINTPTPTASPTRTSTTAAFPIGSTVKPSASVNVRSGAGSTYASVGIFRTTMTGTVTGNPIRNGGYDWYRVTIAGIGSGYVAGSYLRLVPTQPSTTPTRTATTRVVAFPVGAIVGPTASVNVRSGAGSGFGSIGVFRSGATGTVTGAPIRSGSYDWYPVTISGIGSGYVAGSYLRLVSAPTTATSTAVPSSATPTTIAGAFSTGDTVRTTARVNLRSGPSTGSGVLAVVPNGTTGVITGVGTRSGSYIFYPISIAGYPSGYLAQNYLQLTAAAPTATNSPAPTQTNTVVFTATSMPTWTATSMPTETATVEPTETALPTETATLLPTETATALPTETATTLPTETATALPTETATALPTETATALPTETATALPTETATALPTETETSIPTETASTVPTETETPIPTETASSVPTETETAVPTETETALPTETASLVPTETGTATVAATEPPTTGGNTTPTATFAADDRDGDRVPDAADNCPDNANPNQGDSDSDGFGNACDPTPFGDDTDGDSVPDIYDNCVAVPNPGQQDTNRDGIGDHCSDPADTDADGVDDLVDNCPSVANSSQSNRDGDAFGDVCDEYPDAADDADNDGVPDLTDNCPAIFNPGQHDYDQDGVGNLCDPTPWHDEDNDFIPTESTKLDVWGDPLPGDNCPSIANPDQSDRDYDGIGDACDPTPDGDDPDNDGVGWLVDNCEDVANPDQADTDGDHQGDACDDQLDEDWDGDGVPVPIDNCPSRPNPSQADSDNDGIGDACDSEDTDGDGIQNAIDNCRFIHNPSQTDTDEDGIGNECDDTPFGPDTDGDSVPDALDNCPAVPNEDGRDSDADGAGDACDAKLTIDPVYTMNAAILRFTVIDQFGNIVPPENTVISYTITFYDPRRPEPLVGSSIAVLDLSVSSTSAMHPCSSGMCPVPITVDFELTEAGGCQIDENDRRGREMKVGEVRYEVFQVRCGGLQIAVTDADYNNIGGACFGLEPANPIYVDALIWECDTDGDGIVVFTGLPPDAYWVSVSPYSWIQGSHSSQLHPVRSLTGADCNGRSGLILLNSADLLRMTMRVTCGEDRPNPPKMKRCFPNGDCFMVYSIEATNQMSFENLSPGDALADFSIGMLCDTVGFGVSKIPGVGEVESIATSWSCGGAAASMQGQTMGWEDHAQTITKESVCSLVGRFATAAGAGICSVGSWIGSSSYTWALQSRIIDVANAGECFIVPLKDGKEDLGIFKTAGFGMPPSEYGWCYSVYDPYRGDLEGQ